MKNFVYKLRVFYRALKIKFKNRKSRCWSCLHFDNFYYDEVTYECKKHHTCVWGDEVFCRDWKIK